MKRWRYILRLHGKEGVEEIKFVAFGDSSAFNRVRKEVVKRIGNEEFIPINLQVRSQETGKYLTVWEGNYFPGRRHNVR